MESLAHAHAVLHVFRITDRPRSATPFTSMLVARIARPTVRLTASRPATALLLQSQRHCSSAPAPAPAPAPASSGGSSSSDSSGGTEKRLHSSDIAFKPTTDGWGYSNTYAKGETCHRKKRQTRRVRPPHALIMPRMRRLGQHLRQEEEARSCSRPCCRHRVSHGPGPRL